MMLISPKAKLDNPNVRTEYRAAPLKGMNTRDMVTNLDGGFAQRIDNWVCRADGLHVRPGFSVVSQENAGVKSLFAYGRQVVARTDHEWLSATLANPAGSFLWAARGGGTPIVYNGQAWANVAVTGVNPAKLVAPCEHGKRIYAIEDGTFNIWYLGLDAIGGPAQPIFVRPVVSGNGALTALASDGSALYAITSEGELIVYKGIDPTAPGDGGFALAGKYVLPAPVGRRCFVNLGSGLGVLTVDGLLPVAKAIAAADSEKSAASLSRNVDSDIADAVQALDSGVHKWTMIATANDVQWVRSAETGGWSRFLGYGATCWVETADALYFGTVEGRVCKVGGGEQPTTAIGTVLVDSFSRFRSSSNKRFSRIRPHFKMPHPYKARIQLLMDHRTPPATWEAAHGVTAYWQWPEVNYDMMPAPWIKNATASRIGQWRGIAGDGYAAAMIMGLSLVDHEAIFYGADYAFQTGAVL